MRKAYQEYGKVFRIKLFSMDTIVVCDRKLNREYFKAPDSELSLFDVLDRIYMSDGFSDDPKQLHFMIKLVKATIMVREEFINKIVQEGQNMIKNMKERYDGKRVNLIDILMRYIVCTTSQCFIGTQMTDELYITLNKFGQLLNKIIVNSYIFPKWMLRLLYNRELRSYRKIMTKYFEPIIQQYIDDPTKKDSNIIRKALDYVDPETGKSPTNEQVGDILVCLLYVASENTALASTASLVDLARNPTYWDKVKNECTEYINSGNNKGIFTSKIVEHCLLESARMNSHVIAISRKPKRRNATLGNYYIGDADCVALCQSIYMLYDCAEEVYSNPLIYNPERYAEPLNEPKTSNELMTWGGTGPNLCPGKNFAIYEIRVALAMITTNFKRFDIKDEDLGPIDFFSPAAIASRNAYVTVEAI